MHSSEPHAQIARKIHFVETAKIELVEQVAQVMKSLQSGTERNVVQSLGGLIAIAYFLGEQMGVSLDAIDREALLGLPRALGQEVGETADFQAVHFHLTGKR